MHKVNLFSLNIGILVVHFSADFVEIEAILSVNRCRFLWFHEPENEHESFYGISGLVPG